MTSAPAELLFDEILEFLASSPTAEQIVGYQPPVALQQRLSDLLERNRSARLSDDEQKELDEFLRMNRLMSRLKLKARKRLGL
jgi:preprotein translocase subunit Sec63